jgi:septal ring factor EnvC (AmiA/AmiB activator)
MTVMAEKLSEESRRQLGWPAAATLIAAMIGAAAASLALGFDSAEQDFDETRYASSREIAEVKARLTAIEFSTQQMRRELRADIKEVRDLLGELVRGK